MRLIICIGLFTVWMSLLPQDFNLRKSHHKTLADSSYSHCYQFFRGCVPKMFVTSYSVTYCIYIPGKSGFCFHYYCAVYDECKKSGEFWLADRICFCTLHHLITIIVQTYLKIWTYKMPVRYILSSVWVRLSILSRLSIIYYVGLCVFSLPISLVMIERVYILCLQY